LTVVDDGHAIAYDIDVPDLLIRKVPQRVLDVLKSRAKVRGRSLQTEALELLEQAARPTGAELVAWLETVRDPRIDGAAATQAIREARDQR
jgi:plasmid stability protein